MRRGSTGVHIKLPRVCIWVACGALTVSATPVMADIDALDVDAPRGLVVSKYEATIASELIARVKELPLVDGGRFSKGDTLMEFDCSRYDAELKAAKAKMKAVQLEVDANKELAKHRAVGKQELRISEAKLEQVDADVDALLVRTAQCTIIAPFNGRVVEHLIHAYEMPQANAPLIRIVDDANLQIEVIVPSLWLAWLREGESFRFVIDETAKEYKATVNGIAATVDPISQTVKIKAAFENPVANVLSGMSGTAIFKSPIGDTSMVEKQ